MLILIEMILLVSLLSWAPPTLCRYPMHFRQQPEEANADGLRTAHAATAMAYSQWHNREYLNHNIIGIHIYVRIIASCKHIA
jgi:hypothetical protein